MKINFDKKANALYITFQKGKVSKTLKLNDEVLVDVGSKGKILGIEILDATSKISPKNLQEFNINLVGMEPTKV